MATLTVWKLDSATGADDAVNTLEGQAKRQLITTNMSDEQESAPQTAFAG